jgi:hypothetical protein
MAFRVVIDLIPPEESNFIINQVHIVGEIDKPDTSGLPGHDPQLANKLHACHIIAWKIICLGIAQQITGVPLRTAAQRVFGLSDFQANNVSAVQIKEFMEAVTMSRLQFLQRNVSNYYAGQGRANMSAGGKMGNAIKHLNELHTQVNNNKLTPQDYKRQATLKQIELFRKAYDESPFHSNEEKALARGEYVAFWYQIYYGGEPDSTRYAKFLIEEGNGQAAIDNLIRNGN